MLTIRSCEKKRKNNINEPTFRTKAKLVGLFMILEPFDLPVAVRSEKKIYIRNRTVETGKWINGRWMISEVEEEDEENLCFNHMERQNESKYAVKL